MPKQLFKPKTFNCDLTESQISTILYVLEGYSQGNDDEELVQEMDGIFKVLENVVPQEYYDEPEWTNNVNPPTGVELEDVTDESYDEEGNLIP
jgi:hypothetical protein|tara:strand:- start:654 stop:932 length:279 start_codon:yes stop_codon:yes gene_type:complete